MRTQAMAAALSLTFALSSPCWAHEPDPRAQPAPYPAQPPPPKYNYTAGGNAMGRHPNWAMLATGIVVFSLSYGSAFTIGLVGTELTGKEWAPLMAPLAGPFIAIGTLDVERKETLAILIIDGILQISGVAGIIIGSVGSSPTKVSLSPAGVRGTF